MDGIKRCEMGELTHFSLFSGIGGIDLAAEWAGFKTVGQCEYAEFPTKVLEKNFPGVERWKDVRTVTAESIRERGIGEITLLSGGFPCQPHSLAGKRLASADERDLWGEFARVICETKPKWVLGENVAGLLTSENGRFFGRILRDLDEMGYHVGWGSVCAAWVGANHRRERVFIVANSDSNRLERGMYKGWEKFKIPKNGNQTPMCNLLEWEKQDELSESCVSGTVDGIPDLLDRIKSLGNAVVPQQVYPILQAIADIEQNKLT